MKRFCQAATKNILFRGIIASSILLASVAAHGKTKAPRPLKRPRPVLEGELKQAEGTLTLQAEINKYGYVIDSKIIDSTNPDLDQLVTDAFHHWFFQPAEREGSPIPSTVIQKVHINEGDIILEPLPRKDRDPRPWKTVSPEIPESLAHLSAEIRLSATVSPNGDLTSVSVLNSSESQLDALVTSAFAQWKFRPAIENGEFVSKKVILPLFIKATASPKKEKKEPIEIAFKKAKPVKRTKPKLPPELVDTVGHAKLLLAIDPKGQVTHVEVIDSSHPKLTRLAAKAALSWKFKPAEDQGTPVASQAFQAFQFNGGHRGIKTEGFQLPTPEELPLPELPQHLAGQRGYVNLQLDLDEKGHVLNASALNSSDPELERPALNAALYWKFNPATQAGKPVPTTITLPLNFSEG
ncbi:MAG: energy transducer TonB [Verrucomicrobiota bacterium]